MDMECETIPQASKEAAVFVSSTTDTILAFALTFVSLSRRWDSLPNFLSLPPLLVQYNNIRSLSLPLILLPDARYIHFYTRKTSHSLAPTLTYTLITSPK